MSVLDGMAEWDDFKVYIKVAFGDFWIPWWWKVYEYDAQGGNPEDWIIHGDEPADKIPIPSYLQFASKIKVKIVCTADAPWGLFDPYGQLAVDWIKLIGCTLTVVPDTP